MFSSSTSFTPGSFIICAANASATARSGPSGGQSDSRASPPSSSGITVEIVTMPPGVWRLGSTSTVTAAEGVALETPSVMLSVVCVVVGVGEGG